MNVSDRTLELVTKSLDEFSTTNCQLSSVIRKAIRIARLRDDYDNLLWLEYEMVSLEDKDAESRIIQEISPNCPMDNFAAIRKHIIEGWWSERRFREMDQNGNLVDKGTICMMSIPEIETNLRQFVDFADKAAPPLGSHTSDPHFAVQANVMFCSMFGALANDRRAILARVGQRVHEFLSITEKQLIYGQINSDIFEQNRQYVEAQLSDIVPEALEQFIVAYRRLDEGDPESRSHALMSCRRILKSVADKVYPARDEPVVGHDDKERKLTDDKYIARLWQFVSDRVGGSASGDLLLAAIDDLGNRIDRIYNLSSKGVHTDVSEFEVKQCVIQTYLLIGDILHISDQDSAVGTKMK